MSMISYGMRATCARATAVSVAASTSPRLASTPRCSRYAVAERSDSCWPDRVRTLSTPQAERLDVPFAGEQPRHEPVEQAQRHPPEHVPFHLDSLDLDRPLEVARRERQLPTLRRLAEVLDRRGEQPCNLVGLEPPLDIRGNSAEKRVDAEAGRLRLERVERGEHVDLGRHEPDLLLGLPKRRGEKADLVHGLRAPAGEPELAAVDAMVRAEEEQYPEHAVGVPENRRQDGGLLHRRARRGHASLRSRSAAVSRRRIRRASPFETSTAAGRVTPL